MQVSQLTPDNYTVSEREAGLFHVIIEVVQFDPNSGGRLSIPRVQKYGVKTWRLLEPIYKRQGYTVTVLHNPTAYASAVQAQRAAEARQRAAAVEVERVRREKEARELEIAQAVKKATDKQAQELEEVKKALRELTKKDKSTTKGK